MGCDGGTIPKRDELVKLKKKPEQKDKEAELTFKWRHCALSQQVLQQPISACGLGRLYSKSTIIESLLDKANMPDNIKHIRNLKDLKDLKLTKNPAYKAKAEKTDGAIDERGSPYICPIIGIEMSGRFRFIFLWSCGCVMSERAFKQVKNKSCHLCLESYEDTDIVIINGSDEDLELMKSNMEKRQLKLKANKKNKQSEKVVDKNIISNDQSNPTVSATEPVLTSESVSTSSTSKPHNIANGKKCIDFNLVKGSKRMASTSAMQDPVYKKAKDEYSVANDPKATNVFKSLFTSHESDKNQKRAHWITYNPFYN